MLLDDSYPPDVRVTKEAKSLRAAGYEVVLLCEPSSGDPARERVGPVEVVRVPVYERYGALTRPDHAGVYLATRVNRPWKRALADFHAEEGFDALHVHDLPLVRTALRWAADRPVPVVADLHENWPEAVRQYRRGRSLPASPSDAVERLFSPVWRLKRLERACVAGADRVLAVVEEGKAHYAACGADPEDVFVTPNYVDTDEFPGGGDAADVDPVAVDGEFVMLYVGTIGGRHRGLETVVRALPSLRERVDDPRFLVVGTGPYTDRLRAVSRRLGVADAVEFTGWVEFADLPGYVAASDVGLVPHRNNPHTATTIPHKLTQYMACGTPVAVSDVPPVERVVTDADAGVVFPAGDPAGLADAVAGLATDPDRAARLGANARRAVETTYNWTTAGAAVCELYDGLVGAGGDTRR